MITSSRLKLTDRAGRWVTFQVGSDWHTTNDAVVNYGVKLIDDPDRIGTVTALGLEETLLKGRWRTKQWSTSILDVAAG